MTTLITLCLILFLNINTADSACPSGWVPFMNSCYLFYTDVRFSWPEAVSICLAHNLHVVFIDSEPEDKFIASHLKQRIDTSLSHGGDTATWTGGTDEVVENVWMWYGVDTRITGYQNWYHGEPDSGDGEKDEDCLYLVGNKDFKWQDYSCSKDMFFVCEKPSSGISIIGKDHSYR